MAKSNKTLFQHGMAKTNYIFQKKKLEDQDLAFTIMYGNIYKWETYDINKRYVLANQVESIINKAHEIYTGGYFVGGNIIMKNFNTVLWWPTIFKD